MEYFIIDFLQKSRVLVFVEIQKNCTQKSDFELKIVLWNQENYQKSDYGQNLNKKQEKRSLTICASCIHSLHLLRCASRVLIHSAWTETFRMVLNFGSIRLLYPVWRDWVCNERGICEKDPHQNLLRVGVFVSGYYGLF